MVSFFLFSVDDKILLISDLINHHVVQLMINIYTIQVSLCNTLEDGMNALRELPTPGKSGSLFFFSHDMKYILKTIPKREAKLLRMLLPAYYKVNLITAHH